MKPLPLLIHGALFTVALIYAANFTIAKEVMPAYIGPSGFILLRIAGALLLMALYHTAWVKEKIHGRKDYFRLAACAFFGAGFNMLLFFNGLAHTSPINASLIMLTAPILVLLIGFITATERLTLRKILGILAGAAGAILLIADTAMPHKESSALGDILVMLNAAFYAVYLILVKPLMQRYHSMTIMLWTFVFGFIFVLPFGGRELIQAHWGEMGVLNWGAVAFVVLCTTFVAYTFNAWALRFVKPSVVGSYVYLQPLLGTLIAVGSGKYALHWTQVLYALLIFGGVYLVSQKAAGKPDKEELTDFSA